MKSILQNEKRCFICGATQNLEEHHVFSGTANRKLSEKYGLKAWLCHEHHNEPPMGVHHNRSYELLLKRYAQSEAMKHYDWSTEEFIEIFGKNYL